MPNEILKPEASLAGTGKRTFPSFGLKALFLLVAVASCLFGWLQYQYERGTVNRWIKATLAELGENDCSLAAANFD